MTWLYAIKKKIQILKYPLPIWCKIFDSVIQPIALYGSEVWGPLSYQSYTRWDRHPTEPYTQILQMILKLQEKHPIIMQGRIRGPIPIDY